MDPIQISVQAYILDLMPRNFDRLPPRKPGEPERLETLALGLAIPSFWSTTAIDATFVIANKVWKQAKIEFAPITITRRTESVPPDETAMWIHFVNRLTPPKGIGVAFVDELPSDEGGWGGGRIAAVADVDTDKALPGFLGSVLAHELGHILLDTPGHESDVSNLMFGKRNLRVATADLLTPDQITIARKRAATLS